MGATKVVGSPEVVSARSSCYQAANVVCENFFLEGEQHLGQWTNSTFGDCWVGIFYPKKAIGPPPSKERCLQQIFAPMIDTCVNQTDTLPTAPAGELATTEADGSLVYRHYDEASINIKGGEQDISKGWVFDPNWPAYLVMSVNESLNYTPSADTATAPPQKQLSFEDNRFSAVCNIWDPNAACNKALTNAQPAMPDIVQGPPRVSYNYGAGAVGGTVYQKSKVRKSKSKRQIDTAAVQEVVVEATNSTENRTLNAVSAAALAAQAQLEDAKADSPIPLNYDGLLNPGPPGADAPYNPSLVSGPDDLGSGVSTGSNYAEGSTGAKDKSKRDMRVPFAAPKGLFKPAAATTPGEVKEISPINLSGSLYDPKSPTNQLYNTAPGNSAVSTTGTNAPGTLSGATGTTGSGTGNSGGNFGEGVSSRSLQNRQLISPFSLSSSPFTPADPSKQKLGSSGSISPITSSSTLYDPSRQVYKTASDTPAVDMVPDTLSSGSTGGTTNDVSSATGSGGGGNMGEGVSSRANRRQNIGPNMPDNLFKLAPAQQGPGSTGSISPIGPNKVYNLFDPKPQPYEPTLVRPVQANVPGTLSGGLSLGSGSSGVGTGNTGEGVSGRDFSESKVMSGRVAKTFEA